MLVTLLALLACGESGTAGDRSAGDPIVAAGTEPHRDADAYTIRGSGFFGLSAGHPLADHPDRLEAGILRNGEGDYDVHYIRDEDGERLGYVLPSVADSTLIGDIVITSDVPVTASGLRVGDGFGKLLIAYPELTVQVSEIESRAYAYAGPYAFLLSGVAGPAGEVNPASVNGQATIREITIVDYSRGDTVDI